VAAPAHLIRRLTTAIVVVAIAGCGAPAATHPASPDASERGDALLRSGAAALAATPGYHAKGMVAAGYSVDVRIVHGQGTAGRVTYHGITWDVIATDREVFFRGRPLWDATQPPPGAAALGDHWVRMTGVLGFYGWVQLLPKLAGEIEQGIFLNHGTVSALTDATLRGQAVTHLSGPTDTYDVSRDTTSPLPLRWTDLKEPPVNGVACGLDLDGFGAQAPVTAPSGAIPYSGVSNVAGTTPPPIG
jgi:hypothetical protein